MAKKKNRINSANGYHLLDSPDNLLIDLLDQVDSRNFSDTFRVPLDDKSQSNFMRKFQKKRDSLSIKGEIFTKIQQKINESKCLEPKELKNQVAYNTSIYPVRFKH